MAVDEHARLEMYEAFKELVGMAHAATLLDRLPPPRDELTTKQDLRELELRLEARLHRELASAQRNLCFGFFAAQVAFAGLVIGLG